ncbi:MAG: RNB domain-containing ribonuclease, partial [Lacticaseibacillus paracasei]
DVYVPSTSTDFALDGDTVEVRIVREARPNDTRGPEGEITKVVERSLTTLVGEFKPFSDKDRAKSGFIGMVVSHEKKLKNFPVYVKDTGTMPQLGDMTVTEITEFPNEHHPKLMYGMVVETLGNKNDPGVDIMSLVMQNHIKTEFPDEVMTQTNDIPDHVTPEERVNRKDITDQAVVTIDGDDSKDFDDAVVVWKLPNGNFHLGVHIADVSHYVT